MPLTLLVLDCQGVIFENIDCTAKALHALAIPYGKAACERIALGYRLCPTATCEQLFAELRENDKAITLANIKATCLQFPLAYEDAQQNAPFVAGTLELLRAWHGRVPIHVCSTMPDDALRNILTQRKVDTYLAGIHGTPPSKYTLLQELIRATRIDPAELVFVGDTAADLDIATQAGTRFYGCGHCTGDTQHPWGHDLTKLSTWLETLDR